MKVQVQAALATLFTELALAYPASEGILKKRACGDSISGSKVPDPAHELCVFDADDQYVSNTGQYAWKAPGPNDSRGVCPGLNAMANHGYLPHNGVATIPQYIEATNKVFGMSLDLGGFLAVLGASIDGDGTQWSIGGPNIAVPLGTGLTGSHNKYESDVSPCRPDLYQYGNNYECRIEQFKELYDMQAGVSNEDSNYNMQILTDFRSSRFDQSVEQNPYFFNGPFTGVAVQPAAYTFIYRFMSNKSEEHPEGQLTKEVLKSFFGITEADDGTLSGGTGQERIPDNWYRRPHIADYSIPFFQLDFTEAALQYPKFFNVGGNTGKVNTFAGLDLDDLTKGAFNLGTLAEGNNAFCFAFQFVNQGRPDILDGLLKTLSPDAARTILAMGCPQLYDINEEMLEQFPGYVRSNN